MSLILEHNETEEEWQKVKNKLCQYLQSDI